MLSPAGNQSRASRLIPSSWTWNFVGFLNLARVALPLPPGIT
jgi:hypothetical protein